MPSANFQVKIGNVRPRVAAASLEDLQPFETRNTASAFEGAGQGRRLANFQPSRAHINAGIQANGRTLVKRARFLVENNAHAGNAVDIWAGWLIGDGILPRFVEKSGNSGARDALKDEFTAWAKECDAEGQTNFSGLQEKVAREVYIAGECFVRIRRRRTGDMRKTKIPLQFQIYPSEMLDLSFNTALPGGNVVRMGIEFDQIGRRVAYHFWRFHPDDYHMNVVVSNERTRVPADQVFHVFDGRQGGQIRGVPKYARAIVKLFSLDTYDDAELDRKKTAALYAGFVTKQGEGSPIDQDGIEDDEPIDLEPGAMVVLNEGEKIEFSRPADVGGSYEPFMYRTLLQVAAALGIPYAYLTGDTTKGNFSNVRTEIMNFRRRISQFQKNVIIPQLCERMIDEFMMTAEIAGVIGSADSFAVTHIPPAMEWLDPRSDVEAEKSAVRAGFKSRADVAGANGYDVEELDADRAAENARLDAAKIIYDTDPRRTSGAGNNNAVSPGFGYTDAENEAATAEEVADMNSASQGGDNVET